MTPPNAELTKGGTAIELTREDGSSRVLRYVELARICPSLPSFEPAVGFLSVQMDSTHLHVELDKTVATIKLANLDADDQRVVVVHNCSFVMTADDAGGGLGLLPNGAVVSVGDRILWVGPTAMLEECEQDLSNAEWKDANERLLTPGLIDCHAHPVFAGNRSEEFAQRARGDDYLEIARKGGGINATVIPTRNASFESLVELCLARLDRALGWGTTTMEAKSGYALTVPGELRLLEVIRAADSMHAVDLSPTLLGAHVVPVDYQHDRRAYVRCVAEEMIPLASAQKLATAVDVYCDEGAFTLAETETILRAACQGGMNVKAHLGQFKDLGGPELLASLGGLSADHLEMVSPLGMRAMADKGVLATMLPGACVQLRMDPPPVEKLRNAGVKLALATDLNPGTAHSETLTVPMWLATTHFGMTIEEAWLGVTRHGAQALGRTDIGCLSPGAKADFVLWDAQTPAEIPYHYGVNLVHAVYKDGALQNSSARPSV